jgi:hypothetical protein
MTVHWYAGRVWTEATAGLGFDSTLRFHRPYTNLKLFDNETHKFIDLVTGLSGTKSIVTEATGLMYQHWMVDGDDCGTISGMNDWQGKPKCSEKTCPSAALSTINPI